MELKAYQSAVKIYEDCTKHYPEILTKHHFWINDLKFYYYDNEHIVSTSGKNVVTACKSLPDDKFYSHNNDVELFWEYNSHNGDKNYDLYKLKQYNDHKLRDIFWCKKFGLLQHQCDNKYKILEVEQDDIRRPGEFVTPYSSGKYMNLKIYLSRIDKKKLIKQ
ncbi:MAG: hypothetical protein IKN46_02410 [Acholeplasmatales bacterium]|nr:hypothetical protein [Acholeplasmatales bacterium]